MTKRFPINPVIPISEKNIGTIIDTINSSLASASNSSRLGLDVDIISGYCNSLMLFTPSALPPFRHQIPYSICYYNANMYFIFT